MLSYKYPTNYENVLIDDNYKLPKIVNDNLINSKSCASLNK